VLAQLMHALHIRAFEYRPHLDYCRILELECEAQAVAYPTLR